VGNNLSQPCSVSFRGEVIKCGSRDDAIALQNAQQVISQSIDCRFSDQQLSHIAVVLDRYGRHEIAAIVSRISAKTKAVQFLVDAVDYERPLKKPQGS
jgi:hypothetical protein